jgi:hypothetical protein
VIRDIQIPASGLSIQTVFGPCLGPVENWFPTKTNVNNYSFKSILDAGYNMIHFAPLCELGISNSAYCIKDQLALEPRIFGKGLSVEERFAKLDSVVKELEEVYGRLSMTDLVWNHTAVDTEWVKEHPEATYNLNNSPHLRLAYEVDRALLALSNCIANQEFSITIPPSPTPGSVSSPSFPSSTTSSSLTQGASALPVSVVDSKADSQIPSAVFENDGHIELLRVFLTTALRKYRLWEYHTIDVDDTASAFKMVVEFCFMIILASIYLFILFYFFYFILYFFN